MRGFQNEQQRDQLARVAGLVSCALVGLRPLPAFDSDDLRQEALIAGWLELERARAQGKRAQSKHIRGRMRRAAVRELLSFNRERCESDLCQVG